MFVHIYRFFNGSRIVQTMRFATYGPNHLESVFRRTDSILHGSCIVETMGFATYGSNHPESGFRRTDSILHGSRIVETWGLRRTDQTISKLVSDVPIRFSRAVVLWRLWGLRRTELQIKPSRKWFPTYRFDSIVRVAIHGIRFGSIDLWTQEDPGTMYM